MLGLYSGSPGDKYITVCVRCEPLDSLLNLYVWRSQKMEAKLKENLCLKSVIPVRN